MFPPTRTSRSAAAKKGNGSTTEIVESRTISKKQNRKKAAKSSMRNKPKGRSPVEESVPAAEVVGIVPPPQPEVSGASPTFAGSLDYVFSPEFRPTTDDHYRLSHTETQFKPSRGRKGTLFPNSPVKVSPATARFPTSIPRRKSLFEGSMAYDFNISSSMATSAPGGSTSASPRQSLFGRMDSVSISSPLKESIAGSSSPLKPSNVGHLASSSRCARGSKTTEPPVTPQSPFGIRRPAKIMVVASTKQEAEGVLARQQLVRESLFELREILTNLNWKVQQFEALVDKAENDVNWDTAAAEGVYRNEQIPNSGKRLQFSVDKNA